MTWVKEGDSVVVQMIRRRLLNHNQNFICLFSGQTGSGKSYSATRLCEQVDPNFNISRIVFSPKDFMSLLNLPPEQLLSGSAILYDEAGTSYSARDFSTLFNKLLGKVLQSFRHRNILLCLTVPNMSFIDVVGRKLLHAKIETINIDRENKEVVCKFLLLQINPRNESETYYHYPVCPSKKTRWAKKTRIRFSMPNKELINQYEFKRREFTNKMDSDIESQMHGLETKAKEQVVFNPSEIAKSLLPKINELNKYKGGVTLYSIMNTTGLSRIRASQVRDLLNSYIRDKVSLSPPPST